MAVQKHLQEIMKRGNLTMYGLARALGCKSVSNTWIWMNTKHKPSINSCKKIIKIAKQYNIKLTLDDLFKDD